MRDAFASLVDALPGTPARANDLHRALAIDRKLAWKIATVIKGTDLFTAARQLPGPVGIGIVLNAAARSGVNPDIIDRVRVAVDEFEKLVQVHAGDRTSLEMMMSGLASHGRHKAELTHRKAAFRANSYLWGAQARTHLHTIFVAPSAAGENRIDLVSVRGFIAFRRIRPGVAWVVTRGRTSDNDGRICDDLSRRPIDDRHSEADVPLLRDFCSHPLPQFRRNALPDGTYEDEIVEGPVGDTAALTCLTAELFCSASSRVRDEHNTEGRLIARVRTPVEVLIMDLVVHESLFGRMQPALAIYSELRGGPQFPNGHHHEHLMPSRETVEYLGRGPSVMRCPDVPRYAEMAQHILGRVNWEPHRFDVYRARIAYPIIPTSVVLSHPLPDSTH